MGRVGPSKLKVCSHTEGLFHIQYPFLLHGIMRVPRFRKPLNLQSSPYCLFFHVAAWPCSCPGQELGSWTSSAHRQVRGKCAHFSLLPNVLSSQDGSNIQPSVFWMQTVGNALDRDAGSFEREIWETLTQAFHEGHE